MWILICNLLNLIHRAINIFYLFVSQFGLCLISDLLNLFYDPAYVLSWWIFHGCFQGIILCVVGQSVPKLSIKSCRLILFSYSILLIFYLLFLSVTRKTVLRSLTIIAHFSNFNFVSFYFMYFDAQLLGMFTFIIVTSSRCIDLCIIIKMFIFILTYISCSKVYIFWYKYRYSYFLWFVFAFYYFQPLCLWFQYESLIESRWLELSFLI